MSYIALTFKNLAENEILQAQLGSLGYSFEFNENDFVAFIEAENHNTEVTNNLGFPFTTQSIEKQNWNKLWEQNFKPITIQDKVLIRASFHQPQPAFTHQILVNPEMSFGTGHHATTYQMIELMLNLNFSGKKVLDFGCGTGILAIMAEKLGANNILAIDNDDWAITNTNNNIKTNNCQHINTQLIDNFEDLGYFDVVLANINLHVIQNSLTKMLQALKPNGTLLVSGILEQDLAILKRLSNVSINNYTSKDGWLCLEYKI